MSDHHEELPLRDPRSVIAEADYWKAAMDDLRAVNDLVMAGATAAAEVPIALLEAMLTPDPRPATEKAHAELRKIMATFGQIGARNEALAELAGGRLLMLRREAGLPDPDAGTEL